MTDEEKTKAQLIQELETLRRKVSDLAAREIKQALAREKEYQQLVNGMNDTAFVIDFDGNFVEMNDIAIRFFGYSRDELLSMGPQDIDALRSKEEISRLIEGMKMGETQVFETQHRTKAGENIPVEVSSSLVIYQGKPAILSIARNITRRKKVEAQLQLTQFGIDHSQIGVFCVDDDGSIQYVNHYACETLGYSQEELLRLKIWDIDPRLNEESWKEYRRSTRARSITSIETTHRRKDGTEFPVEVSINFIEFENKKLSFSFAKDITERKQAEKERELLHKQIQQQERLAAVGQLAAGFAHDFNNIMAVIVLYTQMGLNTPDLPAKLYERLRIVMQQAKRATDLIQQILDFGRRAVLERRPIDLALILKEKIKLLAHTLPENIRISFIDEGEGCMVNADPSRIQQAVMNLTLNARDAMPTGGELHIHLKQISVESSENAPLPDMEPGAWVRLAVTDTGTGIPPNVLPHIFEPFFTTKMPGQGSGLGLPQVYGIIKQHGGHIDVITAEEKGTTAVLYLPTLVVEPSDAGCLKAHIPSQGQGETILVVEDNEALCTALVDSIESLNYHVLTAVNGREALSFLEEHPGKVALVLSDLVMPEMGGQTLFHALKQHGLSLPMVMLSEQSMEHELKNLQAQGLAGWLLKPPSIEQLAQLLSQALVQLGGNSSQVN